MIRFGLCCQFLEIPIKFRTTTATYLKRISDRKEEFLSELLLHNANSLEQAITACFDLGIGSFRISSQFFPIYTHPEEGYKLTDIPNCEKIETALGRCKKLAKEKEVRLTFHPDQFVVLNTPHPDVLDKSLAEIEYQAFVADLVGADVINIHAGGGYGDKDLALKRFAHGFEKLSDRARKKLTLENDDRIYRPIDLFPLCNRLGLPFVYDVHHHRCLPDDLTIEEATERALKTWNREPLFHISSPRNGWGGKQPFKHHDYINPSDFPMLWLEIKNLTVEVEAKAKEKAVLKLIRDLKEL